MAKSRGNGNGPAVKGSGSGSGSGLGSVTIELPWGPAKEDAYVPRHVDFQLDAVQQQTIRRLFDALHRTQATLRNGRFPAGPADVMRWMLEQVDDAAAAGAAAETEGGE